jgi:protein-disulfide isomerase
MDEPIRQANRINRLAGAGAHAWMLLALLALACPSTSPDITANLERYPVPIQGAPARGAAAAWVTIVEFTDFQCRFCGNAEPVLRQLLQAYPDDVKLVVRNFPLTSSHPYAQGAAVAAQCAFDQDPTKYWDYHDRLFAQQSALAASNLEAVAADVGLDVNAWRACIQGSDAAAQVAADVQLGARFGVDGTPTFFVNGMNVGGGYEYDDFLHFIEVQIAIAKASGIPAADYYDRAVLHP